MDFLPDWHIFLKFASAAIILTVIPGPDIALFVGRAISQGRAAGFTSLFGCSTGIFIQVIAVAIGLSALIVASPIAFLVLKIGGALYLLWLAYQAITNKARFNLAPKKGKPRQSFKHNYLTGLGMNLLNPKVLLFNLTFLPQFVDGADPHSTQKLLFLGLSFIPLSMPFTVGMVLFADKFAATLTNNPLYSRILDLLMATIFIVFAVHLLTTQIG